MKKYTLLFIVLSLCFLFFESDASGFALNISPPSFHVSVNPGESASGAITVHNRGEGEIGILVYTQDWVYNPDGSKTFHAAGTTPLSCAKWIRLFPKKFKLEAGGQMAVQYTVTLPEDAKGGYYAVIFFESVSPGADDKDQGMMVRFAGRLGTIVYLETEGKSTASGVVESFTVTPPRSDKPLEMVLSFKNTGNVYIGAEGTLNIIDADGNVYAKQIFDPINTLPGETREAKTEWLGELDEGTYYVIVTLDIGIDEPIVEEKEIVISSGGIIESVSIDTSSGVPSFSVAVKNTGQLNIDVGGSIEILKADGGPAASLTLKKTLIAPGKMRELKADLDEKLPQGSYKAKAVISIGDRELTKEETFTVK
ncbi:MAG: hypothetical protein ISS26_05630 [Candidatus Omnitrophica bacterium]|nr:hypothetical protein [Candidatus Omnitrophota bacterium]